MEEELTNSSKIRIHYTKPLFEREELVIDKEQRVKLMEILPQLEKEYVGKFTSFETIEKRFDETFETFENKDSRKCYGQEEFGDSEYLMIKKMGLSSEHQAWNDYVKGLKKEGKEPQRMVYDNNLSVFMYIRQEENVLYLGVFGLRKGGKKKIVEGKNDLVEIAFDQK